MKSLKGTSASFRAAQTSEDEQVIHSTRVGYKAITCAQVFPSTVMQKYKERGAELADYLVNTNTILQMQCKKQSSKIWRFCKLVPFPSLNSRRLPAIFNKGKINDQCADSSIPPNMIKYLNDTSICEGLGN